VHSILHCLDGGRADAIELQYLLLAQDVTEPLQRGVLVKVGDSVRVLNLDIADGTVRWSLREARLVSRRTSA